MVTGICCSLLFLAIIIIWECVNKSRKNELSMALYERVQWCATKNNNYRCFSLKENIYNELEKIESQYRLSESDPLCFVDELLLKYRENLIDSYFSDRLSKSKQILVLPCKEYFFFTLLCYLKKHECETSFCGHDMYDLIHRTNYGQWGGQLYSATYSITDYGLVYQKLYYTVARFCEENEYTKKLINCNLTQTIKKCIDTREIESSRL